MQLFNKKQAANKQGSIELIDPPFNIPRGTIRKLHPAKITGKCCNGDHGVSPVIFSGTVSVSAI